MMNKQGEGFVGFSGVWSGGLGSTLPAGKGTVRCRDVRAMSVKFAYLARCAGHSD